MSQLVLFPLLDNRDGEPSASAVPSSLSGPKRIVPKFSEPARPRKAPDVPNLSSPAAMGAQTTHDGVDLDSFLAHLGWQSRSKLQNLLSNLSRPSNLRSKISQSSSRERERSSLQDQRIRKLNRVSYADWAVMHRLLIGSMDKVDGHAAVQGSGQIKFAFQKELVTSDTRFQ